MKASKLRMTVLQRSLGLIWGFPPVRNLTGSLSFLKKGGLTAFAECLTRSC